MLAIVTFITVNTVIIKSPISYSEQGKKKTTWLNTRRVTQCSSYLLLCNKPPQKLVASNSHYIYFAHESAIQAGRREGKAHGCSTGHQLGRLEGSWRRGSWGYEGLFAYMSGSFTGKTGPAESWNRWDFLDHPLHLSVSLSLHVLLQRGGFSTA